MSLRGAEVLKALLLVSLLLGPLSAQSQGTDALKISPPPLGVPLSPPTPVGALEHGVEEAVSDPIEAPSTWGIDPDAPEAAYGHLSLTELELPSVSPGLQALQEELATLPPAIAPSPATEFGFLLTDLAATGLFLGSLGAFTAGDRDEQALYLLLAAVSAVVLPIGAITWAVGEIVDGHRRRSLDRRRQRLLWEIDRELGLYPHG